MEGALPQGAWDTSGHSEGDSHWRADLPNRACSDQGRYVMAFEDGKVVDVPIFDRLPLACVRGENPRVPDGGSNCNKNSEPDGKGGCRCKGGFIDIKNNTILDRQPDDIKKLINDLEAKPVSNTGD